MNIADTVAIIVLNVADNLPNAPESGCHVDEQVLGEQMGETGLLSMW